MARSQKDNAITLNQVNPKDIYTLITHAMARGRPVMIWGPPGIGKSDIIQQIGKAQNRPVIDLRLLLMEPTDLKGIPYYDAKTGLMRWAKPSELPGPDDIALHDAILFLDEINAAPQSVQAAAYQLILNRRVGEYHLPDGVSIVAAGNRETDKAVAYRMPSALANRFSHLEMVVKFDDWFDWAIDHRVNSDVVGFLKAHPNRLFEFDPKSASKAFATPRSWVFVSELLSDKLSDALNQYLVAGTIGDGLALEFMQHRRLKTTMPDPRAVLSGAVTKLDDKKNVELSALYSFIISLCHVLKDENAEHDTKSKEWSVISSRFLDFIMENCSKEITILAAVTALRKYNVEFDTESKSFNNFFAKYGEAVIGVR